MNTRTLAVNGLIAALYFVATLLVIPVAFTQVQFRLSETFNHLIVFNKRYFFGIVLGVFLTNLILSPMKVDAVFGTAHTAISLLITIYLARFIKNKLLLMFINTAVFSFNMFIIAFMLKVFMEVGDLFMPLWGLLAVEEFATMGITIILIYYLNKRLYFKKLV